MSFSLLANIKPHLYLVSCLQTQTFAVGTSIHFSAYQPNLLAQLVNYVAASLLPSCVSEEEKLFP